MNGVLVAMFLVCLSVVLIALVVADRDDFMRRREERHRERFRDPYVRIICDYLFAPDESSSYPCRLPYGNLARSRMLAAESLATLCISTSGGDPGRIRRLVADSGIGRLLLRRAGWGRASHRLSPLRVLSELPLPEPVVLRAGRFRSRREPLIGWYALLIRTANHPEKMLPELECHPRTLTPFALSELLMQFKRGVVPVACESLLCNPGVNVKLLGMALIRHLQLEGVNDRLYDLVGDPHPAVRRAALDTLVVLKSPLTKRSVVKAIAALSEHDRRRFYRKLSAEGYSLQALCRLQRLEGDNYLGEYLRQLIGSYKKRLGV